MFCPKCGAQNPDDAMFCGSCGAPFAARAPQPARPQPTAPQGAPQQPGAPFQAASPQQPGAAQPQQSGSWQPAASSAYAGVPPTPRRPNRLAVPVIAIGAAVVVAAALLIAFVTVPTITGANSRFNGSFEISMSGSPITVTGSGNTMTVSMSSGSLFSSSSSGNTLTGTVDKVTKVDDGMAYKLKDVTYSGDSSGVDELEATILVPRGASSKNPYGRYAIVLEQVYNGNRTLASLVFDYTNDKTARLFVPIAYGDESSTTHDDLAWADATSSSFDPDGSHDNGGTITYELEGSSSGRGSSSFTVSGIAYDLEVDFKVTA